MDTTLAGVIATGAATLAGTFLTVRRSAAAERLKSIDARISDAFDAKDDLISQYREEMARLRAEAQTERASAAAEVSALRAQVHELSEDLDAVREWALADAAWHLQVTAEIRARGGDVAPAPAPPRRFTRH